MNPEEGKEEKRFSAYRRGKLNMITTFKTWQKTAETKLFTAERTQTASAVARQIQDRC